MAMNLSKGQEVSISHKQAKLSKIIVGLGWDEVKQKKKHFFAPKPKRLTVTLLRCCCRAANFAGRRMWYFSAG